MFLHTLSILNYKNISEAELTFSPKLNCLVGNNGEGKTNLLDAVYYLSFCRSSCPVNDSNIIRHDQDFFMLNAHYVNDEGGDEDISCGMKRGSKKHLKRNRKEYKRLSSHIGLLPLLLVSPSDTALIENGSDERRHTMDVVVAQYDGTYIDALNRYNKALQQRNALLKTEDEPDEELMNLLEEQMAVYGETVYRKRDEFTNRLEPLFQRFYRDISQGKENVSLKYVSHCQRGPLLEVIRRDRHKDRTVGYSLHGIHRDDLEMLIGQHPIRREGSQGQNKTFALSLKLAQFELLREALGGVCPILLLDDIFDKLDANRVEQIIKIVGGDGFGQIFITDTNREHLDRILRNSASEHRMFRVENGQITPWEEQNV